MRRAPAVLALSIAALLAGGSGAALAHTVAHTVTAAAPHAVATGAAGDITVTGAYVGDDGARAYRPVYLTLHDDGPVADQLEAVIAPAATSTTWVAARRVHTPAEVAAYAETCGADPRLLAASAAALAASSQVVVPAGGSTWLTPGVARLQLEGVGALPAGSRVRLTLYFASGAQLTLAVPVDAGREHDPVPAR